MTLGQEEVPRALWESFWRNLWADAKKIFEACLFAFSFPKIKTAEAFLQQTYCDPVKRLNIVRPCLLILPQTKGYQSGRYLEPFPRVVLESHEAHRYT